MGLQSAMTTALTGLQGAETIIDVVGNNVANSGTTGFVTDTPSNDDPFHWSNTSRGASRRIEDCRASGTA